MTNDKIILFNKIGISILIVYIINFLFIDLTPFAADDFCYAIEQESYFGILKREIDQYYNWNGRSVAHIIARFFLISPKIVHTILQPLCIVFIIILMIANIYGKKVYAEIDNVKIFISFCLLWLIIPSYGTVFFWQMGSANYSWPLLFCLLFTFEYRKLVDDSGFKDNYKIFYMAFIGILAGWSNENTGVVVVIIAVLYVSYIIFIQKHHVQISYYVGIVFAMFGSFMLITAPGNYARLKWDFPYFVNLTFSEKIMPFLYNSFFFYSKHIYILLAIPVLFIIVIQNKKICTPQIVFGILFLFSALMGSLAFLFSPWPSDRAFTSIFILLIMSFLSFLFILDKSIQKIVLYCLLVFTIPSITMEYKNFYINHKIDEQRLAIISASKKGDVVIPKFENPNKYFFIGHDIVDIASDPQHAVNSCAAKYYNLHTIKTCP